MESTDHEDAFFKKAEMDKLRAQREEAAREMAERERDELKKQHWMHCPKCGMELAEVAFRGVNVDACFACGGMFFDAGEVDKVLEHEEPGMLRQMVGSLFSR